MGLNDDLAGMFNKWRESTLCIPRSMKHDVCTLLLELLLAPLTLGLNLILDHFHDLSLLLFPFILSGGIEGGLSCGFSSVSSPPTSISCKYSFNGINISTSCTHSSTCNYVSSSA